MIATLRAELEAAEAEGAGNDLVFEVDKIELELKVAISKQGKADGKVSFWVLSLGGGVQQGSETAHTFKLTLTPKSRATGNRKQVSDNSAPPPKDN